MSHQQYALSRVKDALDTAKGNTSEASRMIIHWLEHDQTLLAGLVAPHMKGIIAHALSHVAAKGDEIKTPDAAKAKPVETGTELAEALVQSLSGDVPVQHFGQLQEHVGKPGKASQTHVDAIHLLAGKKKDEE